MDEYARGLCQSGHRLSAGRRDHYWPSRKFLPFPAASRSAVSSKPRPRTSAYRCKDRHRQSAASAYDRRHGCAQAQSTHAAHTATPDEVRRFQLYLIESGASICNRNRIMTGVRFLFRITLRRHDLAAEVWHLKEPQKLPPVLSPEEVIAPAALPAPNFPRLRALALFGRRRPEREASHRCRRPNTCTRTEICARMIGTHRRRQSLRPRIATTIDISKLQ
jgi:hypothetical protein